MKYRLILTNTITGDRNMIPTNFRSVKQATEFGEKWKKATPNSDYIVKKQEGRKPIYV